MCEIMDLQLLSFVFLVMDNVTFLSNLKTSLCVLGCCNTNYLLNLRLLSNIEYYMKREVPC